MSSEGAAPTSHIVLDRSRCVGMGICESMAPDYFEVQDDGGNAVLRRDVADADMQQVRVAVASCPTQALRLEIVPA